MTKCGGLLTALLLAFAAPAEAQAPLTLEAKIPLGAVKGRIDHLAIDLARRRLFVAELGNDSVGVVDLAAGTVLRRISGLSEPQGVGYLPRLDLLFVANAKDGSMRIFRGADFSPAGRIDLMDDADNIRIAPDGSRVYVGYGNGGIAIIDPEHSRRVGDIRLKAHPESFRLDSETDRIYANLPNAEQIAVIDLAAGRQIGSWPIRGARGNFPMALDAAKGRVLVAARQPPRLIAYSAADGSVAFSAPICGDSDDLFLDEKRRRLYASCGEGVLEIYQESEAGYARLARLKTVFGARTALFVPELDRLFLAVRAREGEPAAIWAYRPE